MKTWSRSGLSDHALLSGFAARVAQAQAQLAELLADLAEVDARELHRPAGYPSMFEYCVGRWRFSDNEAYKRIQAARAGRRAPALFDALADGRLNLTAVVLLAPRLTPGNAGELIEAAAHKTKAQIQTLLAERFPQPDLPTVLREIPAAPAATQLVPEPVLTSSGTLAPSAAPAPFALPHALPTVLAPSAVPPAVPAAFAARSPAPSAPPARLTPLAPRRFALQVTLDAETHELLRRAQALLGQPGPASALAEVLKRALQQYVQRLEQRKCAATPRPRAGRRRREPQRARRARCGQARRLAA